MTAIEAVEICLRANEAGYFLASYATYIGEVVFEVSRVPPVGAARFAGYRAMLVKQISELLGAETQWWPTLVADRLEEALHPRLVGEPV
jgi:hypothetical protein